MGNQQVKGAKRPQAYHYPFEEKKSRTDWTAGTPVPLPRTRGEFARPSYAMLCTPGETPPPLQRQSSTNSATLDIPDLNGVPLPPGKPIVQLSAREEPLDENSVTDEINLTWAIPKDDGGYPITGYRIEMLDIQTNHWLEITFIEGFEPRCTLSNILYGIMYRFRAIAYNDAGPSEPGDPSDPVVIDVPGVQIAPYFVLMLNDTIALEHERVEFKVKVLGTPKPTLQWFKDDMEVFSSERLDIREEEDGGTVIVREVRMSDTGNIKCVATNILGRATSVGQLIVEAAPRLEIPENYNEGVIFRQDEVIRLKIPLVAKPPPRITWFFDDEPICPSDDVMIENTETLTSLRIGAAKRWHCGEFRVLAQNENGEDSSSILVTVTAPPSPVGKPVVIDISGTTCVLRWEAPQDDGGADVKFYIVEYFRDVWDVWLKAKTTKDCQVSIEDLIPGSRYKFRIKAENAYGISEESEESDSFDVGGANQTQQEPARMLSPPSIRISEDIPASPRRKTWKEMSIGSQSQEEGWSSPSEAWSPERNVHKQNNIPSLSITKEAWTSNESTEEALREGSEMLKDLLRVKKLTRRISSVESDGLPSMASVDLEDGSESSDLQKARKLYAELTAKSMSIDSRESQEEIPDLDAAAREFYNEIRALSIETGGSIENILESIGASTESLASIIPLEKREQLANFEMNLKQMIEEAKQLADESPGRSRESLYSMDAPTEIENRSRKSFSVGSQAESVVSVIEAAPESDFASQVEAMARQTEILAKQTDQFYAQKPLPPAPVPHRMPEDDLEPMLPMSARGRPVKRAPAAAAKQQPALTLDIPQMPPQQADASGQITPDPFKYKQGPDLSTYKFESPEPAAEEAPPLEELPPKKLQSASPPKASPAPKSTPGGHRGRQPINREPSVGSDRYEDIIVEVRKRSLSRPGSRVSSRMGSRTSSQMNFQNMNMASSSGQGSRTGSQLDFRPGSSLHDSRSQIGEYGQSIGKLDLTSLRASLSNKNMASLDLDLKFVNNKQDVTDFNNMPPEVIQEAPAAIQPNIPQPPARKPAEPSPPNQQLPPKKTAPVMALDANQNDTPAVLPTVPIQQAAVQPRKRPPARDYKPDPLVELFPKNIPTWVVLTYTYSVVLILILLVANSTPDGKLYIHFTALWSIILYFIIDEDQDDEIIDGLLIKGGFVK